MLSVTNNSISYEYEIEILWLIKAVEFVMWQMFWNVILYKILERR